MKIFGESSKGEDIGVHVQILAAEARVDIARVRVARFIPKLTAIRYEGSERGHVYRGHKIKQGHDEQPLSSCLLLQS